MVATPSTLNPAPELCVNHSEKPAFVAKALIVALRITEVRQSPGTALSFPLYISFKINTTHDQAPYTLKNRTTTYRNRENLFQDLGPTFQKYDTRKDYLSAAMFPS